MSDGSKFLIRTEVDSIANTVVAGLISNGFTRSRETVDITNSDSGRNRELLPGGGTQSATISGSGIYSSDASSEEMQNRMNSGSIDAYTVVDVNSGDEWSGLFQLTQLELTGEVNGALTFNLTLESSGAITFTPGA